MANYKHCLWRTIWICISWLILAGSLISGCAPKQMVTPDVGYYRSKDYVVYRVQPGDTAESIAETFLKDPLKSWTITEANDGMRVNQWITIPLRPKNIGGVYSNGVQQVPILCYHHFGNGCSAPLCMPAKTFERQMRFLKENGYHVISPGQLIDYMEFKAPLPKKSVLITIDDGYRSVYDIAYPILKKYGFTATLFIYTDYVGVSGKAITWELLRELKENGFTIGSHTIKHSDLTKQDEGESQAAYTQRLKYEIMESKRILDQKLNQDTMIFSYPFGRADGKSLAMARKAGYQLAVTVKRGGNAFFDDPYLLRRDQILKRDMRSFKSRLKTFQTLSFR